MSATAHPTQSLVDEKYDPLNDFGDVVNPAENAGLVATFYERAEGNAYRSSQEGRPVFDTKVFVKIERVGDKLSVNDVEATPYHKNRWAKEYQSFLDGDASQIHGVPIETLPGLNVSRIAELHAVKIFTIENLASVPDSALKFVGMDGIALRDKARAFLGALRESAGERAVDDVRQQQVEHGGKHSALEQRVAGLEGQLNGIGGMLQQILAGQQASAAAPVESPATGIAAALASESIPPASESNTPPAADITSKKDIV